MIPAFVSQLQVTTRANRTSGFLCPNSSLCSPRPGADVRRAARPARRATVRCEVTLTEAVRHALTNKFSSAEGDISRVMASFDSAMAGRVLERDAGEASHQRATSFVEGLKSASFYDYGGSDEGLEWVSYLEGHWKEIHDELVTVTSEQGFAERGNNVWVPPVVEAATTYGPDWRTLVLQDREWDPINTKLFPKTTAILQNPTVRIPSVEVFFAKQAPNTGIKLHTDDCNFILTMHLGLQVPAPPASWIEVGGERRPWEQGKSLVFDTSLYHQTMNEDSELDRIVLLIRFWHPQLSQVERDAMTYLFTLIDDPGNQPDVIEARQQLIERESKKGKKKAASPGRGFGK